MPCHVVYRRYSALVSDFFPLIPRRNFFRAISVRIYVHPNEFRRRRRYTDKKKKERKKPLTPQLYYSGITYEHENNVLQPLLTECPMSNGHRFAPGRGRQ